MVFNANQRSLMPRRMRPKIFQLLLAMERQETQT
jgi:hypothetical protein